MEYTNSFINSALNLFSYQEESMDVYHMCDYLDLDKGNVFNKFLVLDPKDGIVDIPIMAIYHTYQVLYKMNLDYNNKIIISLYENTSVVSSNTFDNCIKYFFAKTPWYKRLRKIITRKGDVYYGGKGIIFNKDYEPLLMCTIKVSYKKNEVSGNVNDLTYIRPVIYINPTVFENQNDMICKGIVKKVIPYYANNTVNLPYFQYLDSNESTNRNVLTIIDNFDKFFETPIEPKSFENIQEELNQTLIDNSKCILCHIRED